jgi:hypothetical protein
MSDDGEQRLKIGDYGGARSGPSRTRAVFSFRSIK